MLRALLLGLVGLAVVGAIISGSDSDDGDGARPASSKGGDDVDVSEHVSVADAVDIVFKSGDVDKGDFCGYWADAQEGGFEELAFESFNAGYSGVEGFPPREVFDEMTSRC